MDQPEYAGYAGLCPYRDKKQPLPPLRFVLEKAASRGKVLSHREAALLFDRSPGPNLAERIFHLAREN